MGGILSDLNILSDKELDIYPINSIRALKWRYNLGLLHDNNNNSDAKPQVSKMSNNNSNNMNILLLINKLKEQISRYNKLKDQKMPDINKVSDDPLLGFGSSMSSSSDNNSREANNSNNNTDKKDSESSTWESYYKDVELIKFIKGDLDRLYLDGVPDDYFQDEIRKDKILHVLFVWSCLHYNIGAYRQGMHELVGTIIHVLESEENYFKKLLKQDNEKGNRLILINMISNVDNNKINNTNNNIEAYAFAIFERIMEDMQNVYNPDNSKFVINFCDAIQGHKLELYDPHLASIMSNASIPSHVYGLRWTRLLMGREFTFPQVLELWDYIFKCINECSNNNNDSNDSNDNNSSSSSSSDSNSNNDSSISISVNENILEIGERIMIAMLIRLRGVLAINDMSESLAVLMKFPPLDNEDFRQSIIQVAERIKIIKFNMLIHNENNNHMDSTTTTTNNNTSINNDNVFSLGSIPSYDNMDNNIDDKNNNNNNNDNNNNNNDSDDDGNINNSKNNDNNNHNNNNNKEGLKYSISTEEMEKAKQQSQSQSSRFGMIPQLPALPQMHIPNLIPSMPNIQRPKWLKSNSNSNGIVTLNDISKRLNLITKESVTLHDKDKVHLEALIQVINNKLSLNDYDTKFCNNDST